MPLLESYHLVADNAALERAGLFVAEGRLVVKRLLEDAHYRIHSVLLTSTAADAIARAWSSPANARGVSRKMLRVN